MEIHKVCSFVGHRDVVITEELKIKVRELIEYLIVNCGVLTFLFGSRSTFNNLCLRVVTELKEKYPNIERIAYNCKSEKYILENEKSHWEEIFSKFGKEKFNLLVVDSEYDFKAKYTAGKASYIERNQAMIDNSDYCVFYYDENYLPKTRKYSKNSIGYYQPNSGTALAYQYAKQQQKILINIIQM